MTSAMKQPLKKVFGDLFNDFCCKGKTLLFFAVLCLCFVLFCYYWGWYDQNELSCLINRLSDTNIAIMGVDIAALAILFALFQNAKMDNDAKNAFKDQSISFIGNALLQWLAFLVSLICQTSSNQVISYIILFFQLWPVFLVFDLIVEVYTLNSVITNKQQGQL